MLARDVHIGDNKQKMLFVLRTSKTHWYDSKPQTIKIKSTPINQNRKTVTHDLCPYRLLRAYLEARGPYFRDDEPFFIYKDESPVTDVNVRKVLKMALQKGDFNASLYSCSSLRAGRAHDLEILGLKIDEIRKIGRWKSNAVYTYLKGC